MAVRDVHRHLFGARLHYSHLPCYRLTSSPMLAFSLGQTIHSYFSFCHITPEHPQSDGLWPDAENSLSIESTAQQTCHALCYINQNEMSLQKKDLEIDASSVIKYNKM